MKGATRPSKKIGLVLPGGGARGAFQVGVLKALAEWLPKEANSPFAVLSGTSAGAINTVVLASKARRFGLAVAELDRVWGNFRCRKGVSSRQQDNAEKRPALDVVDHPRRPACRLTAIVAR